MKTLKKFAVMIVCAVLMCGCNTEEKDESMPDRLSKMRSGSVIPVQAESEEESGYIPLNYDVQKGMWISYIDLAPMLEVDSDDEFRQNFTEVCENIVSLGCNTVYVHVRPFGDALYRSELYPTSSYVPLENGQPLFDPLEIICETAHNYELSVHAWINPLRCQSESFFENVDDSFQTKEWYNENSDKIQSVENSGNMWLNPAYPEVRSLIAEGAAEIAENYNIDGIHYDDYFYPTTEKSFDEQCYAQMAQGESLSNWRLDNISEMCSEIYSAVKSVDERIEVGISPQGNIENNYDFMYADVRKWCEDDRYCDYILPQIYFGFNNSVKPFEQTLQDWLDIAEQGDVKLVIGLGAYKIGEESEFTDNEGIIAQQAEMALKKCQGIALYTYSSLFVPDYELVNRTEAEIQYIAIILGT